MRRNLYVRNLTEVQVSAYIGRSVSEGKNEDQIAERLGGDKTCVEALHQIHYIVNLTS